MIESNFTFNGRHCMNDMGLLYVENSGGRVITHARRINEYTVAGASGTIRFPGETFEKATLSGSLYPMESPKSEADAQALMRQVAAWLYGPRGRLIFDYEPDRYRIAEISGESKWSCREWLDGGLDVEFDVQPFAWALNPTRETHTVTDTCAFALNMGDSQDAPLEAIIRNTGAAALTGISISRGSREWLFAGMSVPQDGLVTITQEPPVGATITTGGIVTNALPYAMQFDTVTVSGAADLAVALSFDGSGSADVTLQARGRWL